MLLLAGLLELACGGAASRRSTRGRRCSRRAGAASALPALAWTAFKVGALSYGGGFVIIPLMHGDAVDAHGWMTEREFTGAVAFGQLTPGPVTQTVALVGYAAAGLGGALLAAAIAFAPSFLVVALGGERLPAPAREHRARARSSTAPARPPSARSSAPPCRSPPACRAAWQLGVLAAAAASLLARRPRTARCCSPAARAGLLAAAAGDAGREPLLVRH